MAWAAPLAAQPDDRLPPEQRKLVAGLTRRGMPELVESLLADAPTMHRVYIARAYAKAASDEADSALREKMHARAADEYRRVIALQRDASWYQGERRRFDVAEWRIEYSDMILRRWIAPDLDQFEITSGLSFNAENLDLRLREAIEHYELAGEILDDLDIGLRTDEERYLLLGIAENIGILLERQRLNLAWARMYRAMTGPADAPDRGRLLDDALLAFDNASRATDDEERKYPALLGAGIALRESGRFQEAYAALERVIDSTASMPVIARAEFELAKALAAGKRFADARRGFDRLGNRPIDQLNSKDAGAAFYIRLAPLLRAQTLVLEARTLHEGDPARTRLEDEARADFVAVAARGDAWQRMAQLYLDALAGKKRDVEQLSDIELLLHAGEAMAEEDYARAEKAWRLLLDRPTAAAHQHDARFNLGVCLFHRKETRAAADVFLEEARSRPPLKIAERVLEYAYRLWRQLAAQSNSKDDYQRLAEAATLLAEGAPDHSDAAEARWVAALALDEGGEYRRAITAYGNVSPREAMYWDARRNLARCHQRLFEAISPEGAEERRAAAATAAVEAWLRFADDLEAACAPSPRTSELLRPVEQKPAAHPPTTAQCEGWITHARMAACSLLVTDELRQFRKTLEILEKVPPNARVLGLQIRCLQAMGEITEANRVLEDYLTHNRTDELGAVLVGLAAEMESEVKRLQRLGRSQDARRLAQETLPTIRHLVEWIESRPEHARHVPVVRFALAQMLAQADRLDDALRELTALMERHPSNGGYLMAAARLREKIAAAAPGSDREDSLNQAEALWAKLLKDPRLIQNAPAQYWEARYHWLRHQLRHGRAAEVVKGIETEQAWHPDLGGRPWQGLLLELAADARSRMEPVER